MTDALLSSLSFLPWIDPHTRRLPGIQPLQDDAWLQVDEAFARQMAERDRLIATTPELVHALLPAARQAADELYARVLEKLAHAPGYAVGAGEVRRPDGVVVPLDPAAPLLTLGRLVQEDLCLMEADGPEHVLTGAILCFPASWTLAEKIGHPLGRIHVPVETYDADIARRVQRLFDAIRPGQPLVRGNFNLYDDPRLFHPHSEKDPRQPARDQTYLRSERQCLVRLPRTGAVLFSIHTYVIERRKLPPDAEAALMAAKAD